MKFPHLAAVCGWCLLSLPAGAQTPTKVPTDEPPLVPLESVASFPGQQVTGVAITKAGRIFVNFPYWSDDHTVSVAELMKDGSLRSFPDATWNEKEGPVARRFVCVQSLLEDDEDSLWVVDAASPKMEGVVDGGAKLVRIDLQTNAVTQVIPFGSDVAPRKSYLNDIRIDGPRHLAFLTDSGLGAIIGVDLKVGDAHRFLEDHFSTKAEAGEIVADGIHPIDPKTKKSPVIHADGLAYDAARGILYFHALSAQTLYKVSVMDLLDPSLSAHALGEKVVRVGTTPKPDGMLLGNDGWLYLAAFEENAIVRVNPDNGHMQTVLHDERLQWPDSLSWGPQGTLYVTTSQIHRSARFNAGENKLQGPYALWRIRLPR